MATEPVIKKTESVNRRGEKTFYETRGTSIAKLGGSYCAKEYDPKAGCKNCPNGSC